VIRRRPWLVEEFSTLPESCFKEVGSQVHAMALWAIPRTPGRERNKNCADFAIGRADFSRRNGDFGQIFCGGSEMRKDNQG